MVALSHGRPIVTTTGHLTEPVWADSGAAALEAVRELRQRSEPVARLAVTISSLPQETAIANLEPRGRT